MNALRHSKRQHNIETETVVRLAFKLMRVAYGEFYDRLCAVIWSLSYCALNYRLFLNWSPLKLENPFRSSRLRN